MMWSLQSKHELYSVHIAHFALKKIHYWRLVAYGQLDARHSLIQDTL